jgi:hypothetical protein
VTALLSWALITTAGATVLAVAFRLDSIAWRYREEREERRLRAELEALRRIHDKGDNE